MIHAEKVDVNKYMQQSFIKGYKANTLHNVLSEEQVTEILSLLGNGKGFLKQLSFPESRKLIKSALHHVINKGTSFTEEDIKRVWKGTAMMQDSLLRELKSNQQHNKYGKS